MRRPLSLVVVLAVAAGAPLGAQAAGTERAPAAGAAMHAAKRSQVARCVKQRRTARAAKRAGRSHNRLRVCRPARCSPARTPLKGRAPGLRASGSGVVPPAAPGAGAPVSDAPASGPATPATAPVPASSAERQGRRDPRQRS
jgi:hypothetical protein